MLNLSDEHILFFIIQMLLLLSVAKVLGELSKRVGLPKLIGEIFTGVLLGATVLGRFFPGAYETLFPTNDIQQSLLDTEGVIGVLFLLLTTGFEVNISSLWSKGKEAMQIGFASMIVPIVIGFAAFWWLPDHYTIAGSHLKFVLFISIVSAISAIPVIAKILYELDILKSDVGVTTLLSYTVKDLLAWVVFAIFLGFVEVTHSHHSSVTQLIFEIVLFVTVAITLGYKLVDIAIIKLRKISLDTPATILVFISIVGLFCGMITQWLGIHALFGFFLAGIMVGNSSQISESTRSVISQFVYAIFVPIFFSTIALRIDFVNDIDVLLAAVITVVSIGAKFAGGWLGSKWARLPKADSLSMGIAHIPGGAMEIILASIGLQAGLIGNSAFVAIVIAALVTTILVGPLLEWSLKSRKGVNIGEFFLKDTFLPELQASTPTEAIYALCAAVSPKLDIDAKTLSDAVLEREKIVPTGLGKGVAIPHARLKRLKEPAVGFAVVHRGINWESRDGQPVRFVFLVLTPEDENDTQVQVLAAVSGMMNKASTVEAIVEAGSADALYEIFCSEIGHKHASSSVNVPG